jgi:hypothetical protein
MFISSKNIDIDLTDDGEDFEIYINGWYLCNVNKEDISPEAKEVLNIQENI